MVSRNTLIFVIFTEAVENNIAAIGITDYFMIEGYKHMLLQRKMQSFGLVRLAKGLPVVDSLKNMIQAKSIIMVAFTVLVI